MKVKKIAFYGLMYLPLISALFALQLLPEQIPAHYGLNNQVTRWGSKYEALIVPIVTAILGYFFLGIAKTAAKHEENGKGGQHDV